jgi:hypothetical protein
MAPCASLGSVRFAGVAKQSLFVHDSAMDAKISFDQQVISSRHPQGEGS